jgi:hypothetical protein
VAKTAEFFQQLSVEATKKFGQPNDMAIPCMGNVKKALAENGPYGNKSPSTTKQTWKRRAREKQCAPAIEVEATTSYKRKKEKKDQHGRIVEDGQPTRKQKHDGEKLENETCKNGDFSCGSGVVGSAVQPYRSI